MPLRIVYVSTLRPDMSEEYLADLVGKAAAFNKAHDITGVLAVEERRVCQILEGPEADVEALFAAIMRDPRHSGVTQLDHTSIDTVSFDSWGMVRRSMTDMVTMAYTL